MIVGNYVPNSCANIAQGRRALQWGPRSISPAVTLPRPAYFIPKLVNYCSIKKVLPTNGPASDRNEP